MIASAVFNSAFFTIFPKYLRKVFFQAFSEICWNAILEKVSQDACRKDTKQALKENLQADGVQSRQTLFVRYCLYCSSATFFSAFAS